MATAALRCPDCGDTLSEEAWAEGLCSRCLLALALEDDAMQPDPDLAPTLEQVSGPLTPGQILGSRYRLRSRLGSGGMGDVWRAFDLKLRVEVALKTIAPTVLDDERARRTLRQEVRTAREVVSPHVCRVYELLELDGQETVSMEYVDGITLADVLHERSPLALEEARELASQLLAGLQAIHEASLVHRDIKPENLMVTRTGRVVVMDFGIAKGLGEGRTGTVAGTPAYMAPEQARGEPLDPRADIFSAGVVLAEMVAPTGIRDERARRELWRGIHSRPPRLSDTPWAGVLARATAAERDRRIASASALARELEEVALRSASAETARPYPGLAPFTEEDTKFFFGRELEVEALWKKLHRPSLLGLIGPSGAGKSSFLRAGLLPALPAGWRAVVATPGTSPFLALGRSLAPELSGDSEVMEAFLRFGEPDVAVSLFSRWRQQHAQVLLVVDQFEELFTLSPPETQKQLGTVLGRLPLEADVHVLLSMRDDFLFRCATHEHLAPLFHELTPLKPLSGAALRRALVEPALRCGYRFESEELVNDMLAEVSGERGALPLLAFAAAQLWDRREREQGLLTRESYESIGGVGGALAGHAEATLERIGPDGLPLVRELFRNLVTAEGTRAAREREELLSVFAPEEREAADAVLAALIDARLLSSYEVAATDPEEQGRDRVEIIHESLLANWPRLVRWQTQDADSARLRDDLRQAARLWEERQRTEDLLWTGTAYRELQLWRERYPGGLTALEEKFLLAAKGLAERRTRRRRLAVAATVALSLAVAGVTGTLWRQSEESRKRAVSAEEAAVEEARRAEASKLLALGQLELEGNPTASLAYATASLELVDTPEARRFALSALWRAPLHFALPPTGWASWDVDFSPDGQWLAVGYEGEGHIRLWPPDGGDAIPVDGFGGQPWAVVFSKDSRQIMSGGDPKHPEAAVEIHSVPDGKLLRTLRPDPEWQPLMALTPVYHDPAGGRTITRAVRPDISSFRLHSWPRGADEPEELGSVAGMSRGIDPTGRWAAVARYAGSPARALVLLPVDNLEGSRPLLVGSDHGETEPAFASNGSLFASADYGGGIHLWSLSSGSLEPLRVLEGHANILGLGMDPSGSLLVAAHPDGGIRLWDLAGPPEAEPLFWPSQTGTWPTGGTIHPSGRWAAVASPRDGVRLWPLSGRHARVLRGHAKSVRDLAFGPDGSWIASCSDDTTVRVWALSASAASASRLFPDPGGTADWRRGLAASPDGSFLVTGAVQVGGVVLLPRDAGPPRQLRGFDSAYAVAVSPDGQQVAAGGGDTPADHVVRVWNLASGDVRALEATEGQVDFVEFTPAGDLVFAQGDSTHLWSLESDTSQRLLSGIRARALSDTGRHLIGLSTEGVAVHDLEQGSSIRLDHYGPGDETTAIALDRTGGIVVTGAVDGTVRVGQIGGTEPHLLLGHVGAVYDLEVSPDGRWIASAGADSTVRLWPMPDLSEPPLHTLPPEGLLAKLRSLTNLRAVRDETSPTGYSIQVDTFPGWESLSAW